MANIQLQFDLSEVDAALGFVDGMADQMKTSRYISSVVKYTHTEMAKSFDLDLDVAAISNPSAYYHVYEWRMVGVPRAHLWKHRMQGGGRYQQIASFEFLPSVAPILTPAERQGDPLGIGDPMAGVSNDVIDKLKGSYTFSAKAVVQEYGLPANVFPVRGKYLFVPTLRSASNFILSKHTSQNFSRANPQDGSGGAGTVGNFTQFWSMWWSQMAPALWDSTVKNVLERDLGRSERELRVTTAKHRSRRKVFKMGVIGARADFHAGQEAGKVFINGESLRYSKAAEYIKKGGVFK